MFTNIVSWLAVLMILVSSTGMVLSRDWRWTLGLCAGQYLAAFWLVSLHWPVGLASVKLVTGWMSIATLGLTRLNQLEDVDLLESFWPHQRWFHFFLAGIIILLTAAASPVIESILPGLGLPVVVGSVLLIGMGLIHLGITSSTLRVILGLLTFLCGFEILYAAIEGSILVAGLLAMVNLGLALIGSYLLAAGDMESVDTGFDDLESGP